ncbi:MAG: restriction endonuclease subunit S [Fermentimonas sp.]|nr:restriction endonuclease subunit S [Fermentimonas sp.]
MIEENGLPKGWVETTLGEVINLIGGGTPKTSVSEYWNGDIPWLSVVDFNNENRWVSCAEKSITELGLKNSSTKLLNIGDIIISARGTVGVMAQLKNEMAFNQSCYGIREVENVSDINFLFYLIKYSLKLIRRNVYGAVFDTITTKTFDIININIPPLPEQKAIASILTSFDDKIELLQAQNETLETIAQTIFKEWFGKYQVGDELPEGWRVGKLGKEFDIIMGQSPKGTSYNTEKNGSIFFQGRAEFSERFPQIRLYTTEPKRMANKFDVLVSVRAPVGDINVALDKCCIGRGLAAVSSNYKSYCLYKLKSLKPVFDLFESEGTVFGSINKASFSNIEVVIPTDDCKEELNNLLYNLDLKIYNNYLQIQTLQATRDTLLPKLMSGQLRVTEFQEQLCEVM